MKYITDIQPGYIICHNDKFDYMDIYIAITKPEFDHVQKTTGYWSIQHDGRPKQYYVYIGYGRFASKRSLEELDNYYVKKSYNSKYTYIFDYNLFLTSLDKTKNL